MMLNLPYLRIWLLLFLCWVPLCAKEPLQELRSADGKSSLFARPVDVDGEQIVFLRATGTTFLAKPGKFAAEDRENLELWKEALENDPHHRLVARVRSAENLRVLFIGNSYSFNIPKAFGKLAKTEGRSLVISQITNGGWTLAKHAASKETLDRIATGEWDVVVLQEQSQLPAFPEPQRARQMDGPAKTLADAARIADAIPVFFLTWGRRDGDIENAAAFPDDTFVAMQARLQSGYENAVKQAGAAYIVPVGKVWSALHMRAKESGLFSPDGSHPSVAGDYLGACVFYCALFNEPVKTPDPAIEKAKVISAAAAAARLTVPGYPVPH